MRAVRAVACVAWIAWLAWIICLATGCRTRDTELFPNADATSLSGLDSIAVTPGFTTLSVTDLATPGAVDFVATGTFTDGSTRDLTAVVRWASDPPALGMVTAGHWAAAGPGGVVTVVATGGDQDPVVGSAVITVMLQPVIDDPANPVAPGTFDAPRPVVVGDATRSPTIAYPGDETMVPVDVSPLDFQHVPRGGTDAYELHFRGAYLDAAVRTTAASWQPDPATWRALAETVAGDHLTYAVDAVDLQAPDTAWESLPVEVFVSSAPVGGTVSYWTSGTQGVVAVPISTTAPTTLLSPPQGQPCIGCHVLARTGRTVAASANQMSIVTSSVPGGAPELTTMSHVDGAWSTLSPDGTLLITANHGKLAMYDASTGAMRPMPGLMPPPPNATMPDWSPLGDGFVFAACMTGDDRDVKTCSIAHVSFDGTTFGAPETLVASAGPNDNNYEPRYSPDGRFLAFVHATGSSRDQVTAEVELLPAAGGTPIALPRLDHRVGSVDGVANTGDAMPSWAATVGPGVQWLTFASTRDYGTITTGAKPEQIWVAAVDTRLPAADPSFTAFWLPAQDTTTRNHSPAWALDPTAACAGGAEVCDGFDNNCDGLIDNDCRPCGTFEVCGDGIDNDCDGFVDEGCLQ